MVDTETKRFQQFQGRVHLAALDVVRDVEGPEGIDDALLARLDRAVEREWRAERERGHYVPKLTAVILKGTGALEIMRADMTSDAIYQTATFLARKYPAATSREVTEALMRSFPAWVASEANKDAAERLRKARRDARRG